MTHASTFTNALVATLADPGHWAGWGGGPGGPPWVAGGWFWVFPAAWFVFWAILLGVLVWYLVSGRHRSSTNDARRILAERYARGELTNDEYRERLGALR